MTLHFRRISGELAAFVLLLAVLGSGCATSRGVLDVRTTMESNPASGTAVKIISVTDSRVFEVSPGSASIPSLKGDEIHNKAITSRAFARKRNSYGKALGDILLPEGRTVNLLAQENITRSLRQSGYRVLARDEAGYDQAIPVTVDIRKFWAWVTPGFWAIALEFETEMHITGAIGRLGAGKTVRGYVRNKSGGAKSGVWLETVQLGLADFVTNLKKEL